MDLAARTIVAVVAVAGTKMPKVLVKLGGSIITYKDRIPPEANLECLGRLAREIEIAWKKKDLELIVVHGAGSFGHIPAHEYRMTEELWHERKREGAVLIRGYMHTLNQRVVKSLVEKGLPAIHFQSSAGCLLENKKLVVFPAETVEGFARHKLIPVLYGDIALDRKTGVDILSGDQIISYLASSWRPDSIVIATDVDGVFSQDPRKNPDAKRIDKITSENLDKVLLGLSGSSYVDVTGGMAKKIEELWRIAEKGVSIQIVNGLKEGYVEKALEGESHGTWIQKQ